MNALLTTVRTFTQPLPTHTMTLLAACMPNYKGDDTPAVGSTSVMLVFIKSYATNWIAAPGTVFTTLMPAPRKNDRSPSVAHMRRTQSMVPR